MGVFDKAQKRKKRLIKKRENTQRASKAALDAMLELQRNILAILIMRNEVTFSPERYYDLLQELSGEDAEPIEYDTQMYWVIVSQLRKLNSWVRNLDPKGRRWQFSPDYMVRVHRQVAQGELPLVSTWLEIEKAGGSVVTETGKTLGVTDHVDHDILGDTDPAAEGGTLHGDEP
jgi:hypothetical protein